MNGQHRQFVERAIELAARNAENGSGGPFGAVIAKDGEVVSEGVNRVTSDLDPTAHAEIMAIRAASDRLGTYALDGCTIYASCEPCPMCLSAILWARIGDVHFGASHEEANRAGFDDSRIRRALSNYLMSAGTEREPGPIRVRHLTLDNARRPFEIWMDNPDRIEY